MKSCPSRVSSRFGALLSGAARALRSRGLLLAVATSALAAPTFAQDCVVSAWSAWSPCSKPCGGGTQIRTRTIITEPGPNGAPCPVLMETRSCNEQPCPVDCVVSDWSNWSPCSVPCGGGTQIRTRTVITPPANGGAPCPQLMQTQSCNTQPCARDCVVSPWSAWSACSATCGGGTQSRTRTVIVFPAFGGLPCPSLQEFTACNTQPCIPALQMHSMSVSNCNNTNTLVVTIDGSGSIANVAGGQFFIGWDTSRLDLTDVVAGNGLEIFYNVANAGGRDIAVRIPDNGTPVGAQNMLTLTFTVSGAEACNLSNLVYFRSTTIPSRVTDSLGNDLNAQLSNLPAVSLDRVAPVLPPLSPLAFDTDAGFCRARRTLSVSATDGGCITTLPATASVGGNTITFPYDFVPGLTTVTWTVSDGCGNTSSTTQDVVVTDNQAPSIACPSNVSVNADVGGCTATLSAAQVGIPMTSDNCGVLGVVATIGNMPFSFPYTFPQGTTTIRWTVTDIHMNSAFCDQTVTVNPFNTMAATIELQGVSAGPFTRCLTFNLFRSSSCTPDAIVSADFTFSNGVGTANVNVPCGALFVAATVTDPLHTLSRSSGPSNFGVSGVNYFASFTGSKMLLGGNFNNDAYIDILDFGGYIGRYGTTPGADTLCGYASNFRHVDFDGNGSVGVEDFNLISFNFLKFRDVAPCDNSIVTGNEGPVSSVSVSDARVLNAGMVRADVNHDGMIDAADVAWVLAHGVNTCPADFNNDGATSVQDIFDYLNAWFIAHPAADFNGVAGITVQDIFDYMNAWFVGCR